MNIKSIRTVKLPFPVRKPKTSATGPSWWDQGPVANPMSRYPRYAVFRPSWLPKLFSYGVVVEADDGTQGFAVGHTGRPAAAVIEDHLAARLVGEPVLAHEKIYDMACRLCSPFGTQGVAAYAISAIDLAVWDLKGRLLDKPVYELLGGPAHDTLTCYATGNDTAWQMELGFQKHKLACPFGPADGPEGLAGNEKLLRDTRALIGPDRDLMLDCWMAFDVDYCVKLAERVRDVRLRWMEETLPPDDLDAHALLRERLPWQPLATGEHWYGLPAFQQAARRQLVDVLQPDINWCGGMTALVKIAAIAEAAGIQLIPHAGANTVYGQHAGYALPAIQLNECFVSSPPGVPLEETFGHPGTAVPVDGQVIPTDLLGFGLDVNFDQLEPLF